MSTLLPDTAGTGSTAATDYAGKTWRLDFDKKRISKMTSGLSACRQAATIAIGTPRYRHLIYSFRFGSELDTLIGRDYDQVKAAAPKMIQACLLQDDRVKAVNSFSFTKNGENVGITFTVETADGDFESSVTV